MNRKSNAELTTNGSNNGPSYVHFNSEKSPIINFTEKNHPIYFYDNPENNPHQILKDSRVSQEDNELAPITLKRSGSSMVSSVHGKNSILVNSRGVESEVDRNKRISFNKKLKMLEAIDKNPYMKQSRTPKILQKGKNLLLFNDEPYEVK